MKRGKWKNKIDYWNERRYLTESQLCFQVIKKETNYSQKVQRIVLIYLTWKLRTSLMTICFKNEITPTTQRMEVIKAVQFVRNHDAIIKVSNNLYFPYAVISAKKFWLLWYYLLLIKRRFCLLVLEIPNLQPILNIKDIKHWMQFFCTGAF